MCGIRTANLGLLSCKLTSPEGKAVIAQDWVGKAGLVFFGFTWCPDVCPLALLNISGCLEDPDPDADRLPIAPESDSPEVQADTLSNVDPRIAGLTGTPDEAGRATRAFDVTYRPVPREDGGYAVDHTACALVFRPDGRLPRVSERGPYDVLLIRRDGSADVFTHYPAA